ncbi:MAG: VOC family protein [Notoacmeibacter sp.]
MRNLDHFVMPVANLALARERFSSLGFTVAPNASHPFGTENCCIFFEDGTFIEPLAIGHKENYQTALNANNAFVIGHSKNNNFQIANGFSHLVIKTDDAAADQETYVDLGASGGEIIDFGRTFTKPDGTSGEVAFRLAFAKADEQTSASFFACQVVKAIPGGRGVLVEHANGAKVSIAVIATAPDPMAFDDFLEMFLETQSTAGTEIYYPTNGGALRVMRPDIYSLMTDLQPPQAQQFCLAALIIGVVSLKEIRRLVQHNNIVYHEKPGWLIVPPAAGQSATLIFQSPE